MTEVSTTPEPTRVDHPVVFDEVYARAYPSMVRLAMTLVDRRADAEQVVQDAATEVFRRFETIDRPEAYFRTAVVNGCRRMLRRRSLDRRLIEPDPELVELDVDHTLDAVRLLPIDQRIVVALRYHQHLTDSEIADHLDVPVGTVKSRLHRALARLREELR